MCTGRGPVVVATSPDEIPVKVDMFGKRRARLPCYASTDPRPSSVIRTNPPLRWEKHAPNRPSLVRVTSWTPQNTRLRDACLSRVPPHWATLVEVQALSVAALRPLRGPPRPLPAVPRTGAALLRAHSPDWSPTARALPLTSGDTSRAQRQSAWDAVTQGTRQLHQNGRRIAAAGRRRGSWPMRRPAPDADRLMRPRATDSLVPTAAIPPPRRDERGKRGERR